MRVLIACEFSGRVRDSFRQRGHESWSCDLEPSEGIFKNYHIIGNCLEILDGINNKPRDLLIAHPPCTYLSNSGVRWLYKNKTRDETRWQKMILAAEFFNQLLNAPIDKIAIENPIIHKYAKEIVKENYKQIIQPWYFGHGETKSTCLWLKNLPKLIPTKMIFNHNNRIHSAPDSKGRQKERSRTYLGIARAMADQWGKL